MAHHRHRNWHALANKIDTGQGLNFKSNPSEEDLKVPAHNFYYDYSAAGFCSGTVAPYGHSNIIVRPIRDENFINTSCVYRLLTFKNHASYI
jgi:hypothetical protein